MTYTPENIHTNASLIAAANLMVIAMNQMLHAPKGMVPIVLTPFFNAKTGMFTVEKILEEFERQAREDVEGGA